MGSFYPPPPKMQLCNYTCSFGGWRVELGGYSQLSVPMMDLKEPARRVFVPAASCGSAPVPLCSVLALRPVTHLRFYRVHNGVIEEFHHHELVQGHQVFLVGLVDPLEERPWRLRITARGWEPHSTLRPAVGRHVASPGIPAHRVPHSTFPSLPIRLMCHPPWHTGTTITPFHRHPPSRPRASSHRTRWQNKKLCTLSS